MEGVFVKIVSVSFLSFLTLPACIYIPRKHLARILTEHRLHELLLLLVNAFLPVSCPQPFWYHKKSVISCIAFLLYVASEFPFIDLKFLSLLFNNSKHPRVSG